MTRSPNPDRPSAAVPLLVLAATDEVAREAAVAGLLVDLPEAAALVYEHRWSGGAEPTLQVVRRVVTTAGTAYRDTLDGPGDCACCAVRDDLVGAVATLLEQGRWSHLVVSPPLAAPVEETARQLVTAAAEQPATLRVAAVLAVVDAASVSDDLLGDELLAERGAGLSRHDQRSVGQAVAAQVEYADVVVGCHGASRAATALLRRLVGARWREDWSAVDAVELVRRRHDLARADARLDLLGSRPGRPSGARAGVWTLDLHATRPVHPGRLREQLERLARGRVRSRGVVWLPTRPQQPVVWDGSGGQLSIGLLDGWRGAHPATRLLVSGDVADERERIAEAFDAVLMTSADLAELGGWVGQEDGFEPWLGTVAPG